MKTCTNRSNEAFVDFYDGQEYRIEPGESLELEKEIANHFFGDPKLFNPTEDTQATALAADNERKRVANRHGGVYPDVDVTGTLGAPVKDEKPKKEKAPKEPKAKADKTAKPKGEAKETAEPGEDLLKQFEGGDRVPVLSSNIISIGYDAESGTLEVEFKGGAVYQYGEVPADRVRTLMGADSLGSYLSRYVKKEYASEKVS